MPTENAINSSIPIEASKGGTGATTLTDHSVLVGSGTAAITPLVVGTNGQVLLGSSAADPAFGTVTSTNGTINFTTGAASLAMDVSTGIANDTGFSSWSGGAPYFDDTTLGSFTVSQAGTGYINGKLVTWTAPQTVTGLTAGNTYIIYIDSTGTAQKAASFTENLVRNNILLFEVLRDSTSPTNNQITVKENHPYYFQAAVSFYAHETIGIVIENNAGGANITLNGTQKIAIAGADELTDHGLYTVIPDSGGVAVSFRKMFTNGAGKWATYSTTDTFTGHFNSAGTVTALGATKFGVYRLYVSKDNLNAATPTYLAVLHTAEFNNLAAAQTAISNGSIAAATNELAYLEIAQLGYIIFSQSASAIVQVIIQKATLKSTISTSGTNIASLISTNTANFNHILTTADTNVQAALETIDDYGSWSVVTTDGVFTVNRFVIANKAGLLTMTLPTTAVVGDCLRITGMNTGNLWRIAQNANQQIFFLSGNTTLGVGGYLEATGTRDSVELVCVVAGANTVWNCLRPDGNITVV